MSQDPSCEISKNLHFMKITYYRVFKTADVLRVEESSAMDSNNNEMAEIEDSN